MAFPITYNNIPSVVGGGSVYNAIPWYTEVTISGFIFNFQSFREGPTYKHIQWISIGY